MNPLFSIYRKIIPKFYGTGLGKIKFVAKTNRFLLSKIKPKIVDFYGNKILLDKDDMHQLSVLGIKGWNFHEVNFIKNKIRKDDTVIDVGANIGLYTVLFSNWVGEKGHVYAIEPAPNNCEMIRKNLMLNNIGNVIILESAATNFNGEANLNIGVDYTGYFVCDKENSKTIKVDTVSLDKKFQDIHVDFVKIDAEGQELNILKGMPDLLKQDIKMMIEFEPENFSDENNPKEH